MKTFFISPHSVFKLLLSSLASLSSYPSSPPLAFPHLVILLRTAFFPLGFRPHAAPLPHSSIPPLLLHLAILAHLYTSDENHLLNAQGSIEHPAAHFRARMDNPPLIPFPSSLSVSSTRIKTPQQERLCLIHSPVFGIHHSS